jgi:hypothetical protein
MMPRWHSFLALFRFSQSRAMGCAVVEGVTVMAWLPKKLRMSWWQWGIILLAFTLVTPFLLPRPQSRFGKEQFDRLHEGMTEAEVIALLGCPPGDYRPAIWSKPDWYVCSSDPIGYPRDQRGLALEELKQLESQDVEEWIQAGKPMPPPPARVNWQRWWGRGSGIDVVFDEHGRAIHFSLLSLYPPRPPHDIVRWVRWRFGW